MATQIKIIACLVGLMIASGAAADSLGAKPSTQIDFNKMIDDSNAAQKDLHKTVSAAATKTPQSDQAASQDKKKVVDFVDVEVGVGETRPVVVDRRFNSVGEARIVQPISVRLITKRKVTKGS